MTDLNEMPAQARPSREGVLATLRARLALASWAPADGDGDSMTGAIDWHGPARQRCPACGRSDRDNTLGISHDRHGGVAHCFRCGHVETLRKERVAVRPGRTKPPPNAPRRHDALSDHGRELWAACRPLAGQALTYLEARGCVVPPTDGDLRWHPALTHPITGYTGPALVALLTDATDSRIARTLHRTWIRRDGTKAPEANPPRLLLGRHRKAGAVCRLWPDDAVTHGLGVAEGVETALSLAHGFTPAWAAIDAGNLADFPLLAGIECLTVAADHDDAGLKAARACAARWHAAGREVRVVMPDAVGSDLNDVAVA